MSTSRIRSRGGLASLVSLVAIALGACATSEQAAPTPPPPSEPSQTVDAQRETADEVAEVGSQKTLFATRAVQRMPIEILEASIPVVAGKDVNGSDIIWKDGNNAALADNIYGAVLGRPDYVTVTEENPAPSSLYVKFMRDMARDVCTRIADNDTKRVNYTDATLWRFAPTDGTASEEQINENLRYLTLRFLGMRLTSEDPYIAQLRAVFNAGRESKNQK